AGFRRLPRRSDKPPDDLARSPGVPAPRYKSPAPSSSAFETCSRMESPVGLARRPGSPEAVPSVLQGLATTETDHVYKGALGAQKATRPAQTLLPFQRTSPLLDRRFRLPPPDRE